MAPKLSRNLILVATLLFSFTFIVGQIPGWVLQGKVPDREEIDYPENKWLPDYIFRENETSYTNQATVKLNATDGRQTLTIGMVEVGIEFYRFSWLGYDEIQIWHLVDISWGLGLLYTPEELNIHPISLTDILKEMGKDVANASYLVARCGHGFTYHIHFTYNTTQYGNFTSAWEDGYIWVLVGMGWDSEFASMNAWTLIGQILMFQNPDIHPLLNGLIAIPLWVLITYLVYSLITQLIPFTGG